jgi:hypothetical protein
VAGALRRPLVPVGADQVRNLGFHQRLREDTDAFSQHIAILLLEELANKRRQIHSGLGHRRSTSRVVLLQPERTHGKMCDGRFTCRAAAG